MRNSILTVGVLLILTTTSWAANKSNSLIVLNARTQAETEEAISLIEYYGGEIRHVFVPDVLFGYVPPAADNQLAGRSYISEVIHHETDPDAHFVKGNKFAIEAWNNLTKGEKPQDMIEGAGRLWDWNEYIPPRIGVGDLSKGDQYTQQFGGYFWPHDCHQNGLEADIRYVRNDELEDALNIATDPELFDEEATKALIRYLIENADVDSIFVDGVHSSLTQMGYSFIVHKSNHSDHFHVRIEDPDGIGN